MPRTALNLPTRLPTNLWIELADHGCCRRKSIQVQRKAEESTLQRSMAQRKRWYEQWKKGPNGWLGYKGDENPTQLHRDYNKPL